MQDSEGNRLLDGMAGLWCVNVGYSRPELVEAAAAQMSQLPYYNTFFKTTTPPASLPWRNASPTLAPEGLNHAFFACSGSEAVDTALRMARVYWQTVGQPEKKIIIGREYGYHGSTTLGASAGGMEDMHRQAGDMPHFAHVMPPYWYGYGGQMSRAEFGLYAARSWRTKSKPSARKTSPPSSASRCKGPAASSSRRRPTGRRSTASAANTTSCSSPMKSSAASAAPAKCSARIISASSRT